MVDGFEIEISRRSGFDLLIQALDLKPGDEVIFSALNVKGMVRIVRDAGLVPVPVDLDLAHMGPRLEKLKAAITPRSGSNSKPMPGSRTTRSTRTSCWTPIRAGSRRLCCTRPVMSRCRC